MHQAIASRAAVAKEFLSPAWKWLVAIPFAVLGVAQAIRDELLAPEKAAQWNLFRIVPNIDWKWYALMLIGVIALILFEGAYRAVRTRENSIAQYASLLTQQDSQLMGVL